MALAARVCSERERGRLPWLQLVEQRATTAELPHPGRDGALADARRTRDPENLRTVLIGEPRVDLVEDQDRQPLAFGEDGLERVDRALVPRVALEERAVGLDGLHHVGELVVALVEAGDAELGLLPAVVVHQGLGAPQDVLQVEPVALLGVERVELGEELLEVVKEKSKTEIFFRIDVKPQFEDTPQDWEDRLEAAFT